MNKLRLSSGGLIAFLSRLFPRLKKQPKPQPVIKAEITAPSDESWVPYRIACEGIYSYVPDNMELWLVLYSEEQNLFYPQPGAIMLLPGGRWHAPATIGPSEREGLGKSYDLLLIVTSRSGAFQLVKYAHEALQRGKWPGMPGLPRGSVILDKVTITRA